MKKNCMCDFHTHILPGIDDGADSLETSVKLIKREIEQGVTKICLTPHFNISQDVNTFIKKRNIAFQELKTAIDKAQIENLPQFYLGAEVELTYETPKIQDLNKLCIGDTDLLLLEPPYSYWGEWILNAIFEIKAKYNITPVIAHIDRYIDNEQSKKIIDKLLEMNVLVQINAYNLSTSKIRSIIRKMKASDYIPFIGSDAHSPDFRNVTMNKVNSLLNQCLMTESFISKINEQTSKFLK